MIDRARRLATVKTPCRNGVSDGDRPARRAGERKPLQPFRAEPLRTKPGAASSSPTALKKPPFADRSQPAPGQQIQIRTHPIAEELTLAVYEEVIKVGVSPFVSVSLPGLEEIFYKYAHDAQLDYVSPVRKLIMETFDANLVIWTEHNTRELSGIDPNRMARTSKASAPTMKAFFERAARGEVHWLLTAYPSQAMAQEADMGLLDYREFVYGAGMLNEPDPVAFWKAEGERQQKLVTWLKGRDQVVFKGESIDLSLSIKDRLFIPCDGKVNFPDGEIFTGPVEDSANGRAYAPHSFGAPRSRQGYYGSKQNGIELESPSGTSVSPFSS